MKRAIQLTTWSLAGVLVLYVAAYKYTYSSGGFVPYLNQTLGARFHCSFDWIHSVFAPARMVEEIPKRRRWRRDIGGTWRGTHPGTGKIELELAAGAGDSLEVIRVVGCPFFEPGEYPVGFYGVPVIEDASFYRNFTRVDGDHLWIDVLSTKLGWRTSRGFQFTRVP